jgi:hypothetical protein
VSSILIWRRWIDSSEKVYFAIFRTFFSFLPGLKSGGTSAKLTLKKNERDE